MAQSRGTLPGDAGHRRPADADGRLGQVPARLARLRGRPVPAARRRTGCGPTVLGRLGGQRTASSCCCPTRRSRTNLGAPCGECGERYFYSDQGNDLDNTMTRDVEGGGRADRQVNYEIEDGLGLRLPRGLQRRRRDLDERDRHLRELRRRRPERARPHDTGITGNTSGWVDLTATCRTTPTASGSATHRRRCRDRASRSTTSPLPARRSARPRPARAGRSTASAPLPARTSRSTPTPTSWTTVSTSAATRCSVTSTTSRASRSARTGWTSSRTARVR